MATNLNDSVNSNIPGAPRKKVQVPRRRTSEHENQHNFSLPSTTLFETTPKSQQQQPPPQSQQQQQPPQFQKLFEEERARYNQLSFDFGQLISEKAKVDQQCLHLTRNLEESRKEIEILKQGKAFLKKKMCNTNQSFNVFLLSQLKLRETIPS